MKPELIIAGSALVVSVLSLGFTVWAQGAQRKHMRLLVRPVAAIPVADFENRVAVWLANKGLGPMRITALTVKDARGEVHSEILSHMPELPPGVYWTNFHGNVDGALLEAGKSLDLLILEGDAQSASFRTARDAVRRRLSELTVRVEYQDLYERKMLPEEKALSWFGRHQK
jgi:hypothetical protein